MDTGYHKWPDIRPDTGTTKDKDKRLLETNVETVFIQPIFHNKSELQYRYIFSTTLFYVNGRYWVPVSDFKRGRISGKISVR